MPTSRKSHDPFNKSLYSSNQHSVVMKLKKLKSTEDRIYETEKRLAAIQSRNEKMESKNMQYLKRSEVKDEARRLFDEDKKMKQQYLMRKSFNIDRYHQKAEQERISHKKKLQQLKNMMLTQNNWRYRKTRKQREQHEKSIKKQKIQQLYKKQERREKMSQQEKQRLAYVAQFKKNQEKRTKMLKEQQLYAIQSRIEQRNHYLSKLEDKQLRASRLRERINPEQMHSRTSRGSFYKQSAGIVSNQ